MKHFLFLILKSLKYRPIRSWLTILGIVIGIMLVVIISALGSGIKNVVAKTLEMFGPDLIIILPGKETNPFLGFAGGQRFKDEDIGNLKNISGVKLVMPMDIAILTAEFKGEKKSVMFHAQPWQEMKIISEESKGVRIIEGGWPENNEAKEIVLGYRAAFKLFKNKPKIGNEIIIKGKSFKVKGIFSEIGLQDEDNQMYLSHKNFRNLTSRVGFTSSAIIKIISGSDLNLIVRQIKFQLSKQEAVREFSVLTAEKANRIVENVLSIIEFVLFIIAFISLIVGAVGIMNTMYTAVLERTKQIGIMKAIGASADAILSFFLIESGMIGLIGGILGIFLGLISAYIIGLIAGEFGIRGLFSLASLDFLGLSAILAFTFIIGIISGILPARQAAKMEPAEALRYE